MSPLLRDGDVVWVRPVEPGSVEVGDVVLCSPGDSPPGRVVVHRVVRRRTLSGGLSFVVQGDRVAQPDGMIPGAQVYGRVAAIEREGRQIEMDRPLVRLLGRLAVLRSRWNLVRGRWARPARQLVRRLPGLSRYLA